MGLDAADLLAIYDDRIRAHVAEPLPAGVRVERDGPLVRLTGSPEGGWILYRELGGLEGEALDRVIARQVGAFAARGEAFEWKLHGHDRPADLAARLLAAGFVPEATETVMIAPVAELPREPRIPPGVTLREVRDRRDLDHIEVFQRGVWQDGREGKAQALADELAADPGSLAILVAEAAGEVVSAAWVRFVAGTEFATLWGGTTDIAWRGRGIYRALVAARAGLAAARGHRYLQVDASSDSRPILERLGFVAVTTTTPYIWTPAGAPPGPGLGLGEGVDRAAIGPRSS